MPKIEFQYTWCDYLTPCPYRSDGVMVGDYDCSQCNCHEFMTMGGDPLAENGMKKYFITKTGQVECRAENP